MPTPQSHLQACLDKRLASGQATLLQAAAYHPGQPIVATWAGVLGLKTGRTANGDRLLVVFSSTTGIHASVIHRLAGQAWPTGLGNCRGSETRATTCVRAFGHTRAGSFTAYAAPASDLASKLCKTRPVDTRDPDRLTAGRFECAFHPVLGV